MPAKPMTDAQINHLRRLLGWVRCEVGESPEEMKETLRRVKPAVEGSIDQGGYDRLEQAYEKSTAVPAYVRAAIKSLAKLVEQQRGEVVDGEVREQARIELTEKLRKHGLRVTTVLQSTAQLEAIYGKGESEGNAPDDQEKQCQK